MLVPIVTAQVLLPVLYNTLAVTRAKHTQTGMLTLKVYPDAIMMEMKNSLHYIISWDIVTNVVPMHSAFQAPLYELNLTLLIRFVLMLPYLSMLFICELSAVQENSKIKNMSR